jgi:hypothetical protein
MTFFARLRNKLRSRKQVFPEARHVIVPAFVVGGRQYYRFDDHLNVPYNRALSCLVYYRELEMNISHEFLVQHLDAIDKILKKNPIDIFKVKSLNDQLRQRAELPKDPELLYKLASVIFFDKDEKPEQYEWEYAKKKIAFWKEQTSLSDFFLQKPIKELIPYLQFAEENLDTFSQMIREVNALHSANLSAS